MQRAAGLPARPPSTNGAIVPSAGVSNYPPRAVRARNGLFSEGRRLGQQRGSSAKKKSTRSSGDAACSIFFAGRAFRRPIARQTFSWALLGEEYARALYTNFLYVRVGLSAGRISSSAFRDSSLPIITTQASRTPTDRAPNAMLTEDVTSGLFACIPCLRCRNEILSPSPSSAFRLPRGRYFTSEIAKHGMSQVRITGGEWRFRRSLYAKWPYEGRSSIYFSCNLAMPLFLGPVPSLVLHNFINPFPQFNHPQGLRPALHKKDDILSPSRLVASIDVLRDRANQLALPVIFCAFSGRRPRHAVRRAAPSLNLPNPELDQARANRRVYKSVRTRSIWSVVNAL